MAKAKRRSVAITGGMKKVLLVPMSAWQLRAEALARILEDVRAAVYPHLYPAEYTLEHLLKKARRVVRYDRDTKSCAWAGGDGDPAYVTNAALENPAPPPIRLTVFVDGTQRERMEHLAEMAGIPIEAIVAEAVDVVLAKNAVEPTRKRTR